MRVAENVRHSRRHTNQIYHRIALQSVVNLGMIVLLGKDSVKLVTCKQIHL